MSEIHQYQLRNGSSPAWYDEGTGPTPDAWHLDCVQPDHIWRTVYQQGHEAALSQPAGVTEGPLSGKYGDVLRPFVVQMERELHANAGKGDRPGWLKMSPEVALLEIYYHLSKLQKAVKDDNGPGIQEYAADVANMSMMLLDICGGLGLIEGTATTPAVTASLPGALSLCEQLQQKCSQWGTYWRAPDAHGVILNQDQAMELLRDALGVEVEVSDWTPATAPAASGVDTSTNEAWAARAQEKIAAMEAATGGEDDMCPNCVTPWKCNGPHESTGGASVSERARELLAGAYRVHGHFEYADILLNKPLVGEDYIAAYAIEQALTQQRGECVAEVFEDSTGCRFPRWAPTVRQLPVPGTKLYTTPQPSAVNNEPGKS